MPESKLDKVEGLMRIFWPETDPSIDLRKVAAEALKCAERNRSQMAVEQRLGELQQQFERVIDGLACKEIVKI